MVNLAIVCPMRKGGPCVKKECAWYNEVECSILSIAKIFDPDVHNIPDDDVPF